ncbi:hypothetical protein C7H19_06200 [Aphanothece hegewaldii CCALA 016]|uniref:Peptide O-xylosyltransferase n=1 Tax=Aphanothece hegewaldii CCALA 016 TaxID=2107694 RepID=A0A2T1M086_9CHRO|nr:beta-1,6-N-acetylglucosaminyltransferase [Aphanothece hegewaldii]PSF38060.1 hypothetical protein C7H19_06200 [Aphanothece hegewaldii CCALA 016]
MKIAYLILAHDNHRHLQRLVEAISSPLSMCFIHIDQKSDLCLFSSIKGQNVVLSNRREAVYWGDFSMVEATLILIRQALADPRCFDRFVLLSGTDYPLRSVSYIESFFKHHPAVEFINLVQMPAETERKLMWRLTCRVIRSQDPLGVKLIKMFTNKLRIGIVPRHLNYKKCLGHLIPYAGDQWWALSREACQYIQTFVEKEPVITNFFKDTFCPDEMFFQIILGNSSFKPRIYRNITYMDWGDDINSEHPAWISEKHLDDIFGSNLFFKPSDWYGAGEMLFARKFSDEGEKLVFSIMQRIVERENHQAPIQI